MPPDIWIYANSAVVSVSTGGSSGSWSTVFSVAVVGVVVGVVVLLVEEEGREESSGVADGSLLEVAEAEGSPSELSLSLVGGSVGLVASVEVWNMSAGSIPLRSSGAPQAARHRAQIKQMLTKEKVRFFIE